VGGGDGPLGDETGSIAVFQAVCNDNLLNVTDLVGSITDTPRSLIRWSPKTEIIDRVDVDVLT